MRAGVGTWVAVIAASAVAGCGGDGGSSSEPARGEKVSEEIFGYELRLPDGWRSLGRADKNSSLKFGDDGKGCQLDGGAPAPPVDKPESLLDETKSNYERHAEKPPGARPEFKIVDVPGPAIAVQGRVIGPGEKRHAFARIVSASAAITLSCDFDEDREKEMIGDLAAIYQTVELTSSDVAERLQPALAVLPAVQAAHVHDEAGQLAVTLDVDDMKRAESSSLAAARLLYDADPERRIAVVAEDPLNRGPVIQAQIEAGTRSIRLFTPERTRRVPIDE